MRLRKGLSWLTATALAVPALAALALSAPNAWAGTTSNQVQFSPEHCNSTEWNTLFTYNSLITVSGLNQNGNWETWKTTNHPEGVFLTTGWWWWGQVVVTLHPAGLAPITITGYVPPTHSSYQVEVFNDGGPTVLFTCWGSRGVTTNVVVPKTGFGSALACVSSENPTGEYYQQKTYTGRFYFNGYTYISGSTGGEEWTSASVMTVYNAIGQAFAVPRESVISTQEVCWVNTPGG